MRRWLLLLALPALLAAFALARPSPQAAQIVSAATAAATPTLPTGNSRAAPQAQPRPASTPQITLGPITCSPLPQQFPLVNNTTATLPLLTGYSLSTNAPFNPAVPNVLLDAFGPVPAMSTLTLTAGPGGSLGTSISPQPFVNPNTPNALVSLSLNGSLVNVQACTAVATSTIGTTLNVSNVGGEDIVDCTGQAFGTGTLCTNFSSFCADATACPNNCQTTNPPCATIQFALSQARDGDTIQVSSTPEPYLISTPIEVPILVHISASGGVTLLESANGDPIFHVTATGSSQQHVEISGFTLGGTTSASNPGAIQLDGDSFTNVSNNFIGQEDLPNGIGILLRNSDHPTIDSNTIHGSTVFTEAGELQIGAITSGFGVVTAECLGNPEPSDSVTITNNLLTANSNAAIWLCSDQGGGHTVSSNTVRNNGRGIVLFNVVDAKLDSNVIDDNLGDGMQVVGESANDTLSNNTVESQTGKDSAGIRLYGNGGVVFPLNTLLTGNNLRRNTFDIVIAGARATNLSSNIIEAGDYRTGVYLLVGSLLGGGAGSQPTDTVLNGNTLLYDGFCTATAGCAIRLAPGVVTTVDAHSNNFGFPSTSLGEIRAIIYDQSEDPTLGQVIIAGTPPLSGPGTGTPPTPAPVTTVPPATQTPVPTVSPAATTTATPPSGTAAICNDGFFTGNTDTVAGCTGHGGVRQTVTP